MSRYELSQARYGQLNRGYAVMVFVTEEFDAKSQVKIESHPSPWATTVLKLNRIKRFNTGIYDYSLMTSAFSSIDTNHYKTVLKLTTSIQDWCGHIWLQLNNHHNFYTIKSFSYFQESGDENTKLSADLLEDGIWNQIRLDPSSLAIGSHKMIPSAEYSRMLHKKFRAYDVEIGKEKYTGTKFRLPQTDKQNLLQYTIHYPELNRKLMIVYEKNFPYQIAGWQDTFKSGWGKRAQVLTSSAKLTHVVRSAYWKQNTLKDKALRKKLGLD